MLTSRTMILVLAVPALLAAARVTSAQTSARPRLAASDALSDSAQGTPFGLRMGLTRQELAALGELEPLSKVRGFHLLKPVPQPHDAFEGYAVAFSDKQGLCSVVAVGNNITTGTDGADLKAAFQRLDTALAERCGKHLYIDSLRVGSRLTKPSDWMSALGKEERVLYAAWDREEKSSLPTHLEAISLTAVATSKTIGYVKLAYQFTNFSVCVEEIEGAKSG